MTPQEIQQIIKRLARSEKPIEFATTPARAFVIVAQLQLALRHPGNTGDSRLIATEIITNLAIAIATTTDTPEILEFVEAGFYPELDLSREEAEDYFLRSLTYPPDECP